MRALLTLFRVTHDKGRPREKGLVWRGPLSVTEERTRDFQLLLRNRRQERGQTSGNPSCINASEQSLPVSRSGLRVGGRGRSGARGAPLHLLPAGCAPRRPRRAPGGLGLRSANRQPEAGIWPSDLFGLARHVLQFFESFANVSTLGNINKNMASTSEE